MPGVALFADFTPDGFSLPFCKIKSLRPEYYGTNRHNLKQNVFDEDQLRLLGSLDYLKF